MWDLGQTCTFTCVVFPSLMTLLPALVQSSLGEKCAVYLDQVTDLPLHLQSLRLRLDRVLTYLSSTPLGPLAQKLPVPADDQLLLLFTVVLVCLCTVAVMSWRNPLGFLRRTPSYAPASNPQVTEEDFSYITPGDILDPPVDESEPDIIALRCRGTLYPLKFRAYAIDDGALTVGHLREAAAKQLNAQSPDHVRLMYKGRLLKDDEQTCKAQGLKQHSEVLSVVSEVASSQLDESGQNLNPTSIPAPNQSRPTSSDASSPPTPTGKSKNKRKNKGRKRPTVPEPNPQPFNPSINLAGEQTRTIPEPTTQPFDPIRNAAGEKRRTTPQPVDWSSDPAQPPNLKLIRTPLEQISALAGWLQQEIVPRCYQYMADPPSDPKKRDYEYKRLSETILAQVMLKADGIEPDGNSTAREARRALIKEAQATLNKLDSISKL